MFYWSGKETIVQYFRALAWTTTEQHRTCFWWSYDFIIHLSRSLNPHVSFFAFGVMRSSYVYYITCPLRNWRAFATMHFHRESPLCENSAAICQDLQSVWARFSRSLLLVCVFEIWSLGSAPPAEYFNSERIGVFWSCQGTSHDVLLMWFDRDQQNAATFTTITV